MTDDTRAFYWALLGVVVTAGLIALVDYLVGVS